MHFKKILIFEQHYLLNHTTMAEETKTKVRRNTTSAKPAGEPQRITIEVTRYKSLLEALGDWKKVFRVIVTISFIGVLLFAGITLVVLSVKRIYPYSDITTNAFGATTIKNEKSEVSYWLLNTAELWGNSGIHVKKGQVVRIIASGKKHTAIHHLVDETRNNKPRLSNPWSGTEGFEGRESKRDTARSRYKIFPNANQDALLMQIVPVGSEPKDRPRESSQAIRIGEQREVHIEQDGILYFTVNDIVLDTETIVSMMCEIVNKKNPDIESIAEDLDNNRKTITYESFLEKFGTDSSSFTKDKYGEFEYSNNPDRRIELYGYFKNGYKTPWFEDNVGSFLIIVETLSE